MTALSLLRYLSALRGGDCLDRAVVIAEKIMKLDLRRKVRTFSTGMKQKLALAQAFADPVDILILDEPTSALDPTARSEILGLVSQAKGQGQTVIFSGHVLSEVEQVCDRVAIMRKGRLMLVEDMHARRQDRRLILARFGSGFPEGAPDELEITLREKRGAEVGLFEHRGAIAPLLRWMADAGVTDLAVGTEDLRSLYDQFHGPNAAS
jgi:ABC-2 type transport system ATP-binding protein